MQYLILNFGFESSDCHNFHDIFNPLECEQSNILSSSTCAQASISRSARLGHVFKKHYLRRPVRRNDI
jgi:hypothetical protein